jgi:hypothetical protein
VRRGSLALVANLAETAQEVPLDGAGTADVVLAWDPEGTRVSTYGVHLPARASAVVRLA